MKSSNGLSSLLKKTGNFDPAHTDHRLCCWHSSDQSPFAQWGMSESHLLFLLVSIFPFPFFSCWLSSTIMGSGEAQTRHFFFFYSSDQTHTERATTSLASPEKRTLKNKKNKTNIRKRRTCTGYSDLILISVSLFYSHRDCLLLSLVSS